MLTHVLLILILIVVILGFTQVIARNKKMREEIQQGFNTLEQELTEITTAADGVLAVIDHQNEQLKAIAAGNDDAETIRATLSTMAAEADAVKVRLANAVIANTAATSEDKPLETPAPVAPDEPTGGTDTGGGGGGDAPVTTGTDAPAQPVEGTGDGQQGTGDLDPQRGALPVDGAAGGGDEPSGDPDQQAGAGGGEGETPPSTPPAEGGAG